MVIVRRGDVLAAWSGIRPLVSDPSNKKNTQAISRNHVIDVSQSKMVTIAGGEGIAVRYIELLLCFILKLSKLRRSFLVNIQVMYRPID